MQKKQKKLLTKKTIGCILYPTINKKGENYVSKRI